METQSRRIKQDRGELELALSPEEYMKKYAYLSVPHEPDQDMETFEAGKKPNATKRRIEKYRKMFGITTDEFEHPEPIVPLHSAELPVMDANTGKIYFPQNSSLGSSLTTHTVAKKKKKWKGRICQIAYWYLSKYLRPDTASWIEYRFRNDYNGFVRFLYKQASVLIRYNLPREEMTLDEYNQMYPPLPIMQSNDGTGAIDPNMPGFAIVQVDEDSDEIPDYYWEMFQKYCKKHKLKKGMTAKKRRKKFLKHTNKLYRKSFGKSSSAKKSAKRYMSTALAMAKKSTKDEIDYMLHQHKANYKMIKGQVDEWVKRGVATREACDSLLERSRDIIDQYEKRMKELNKTLKQQRLTEERVILEEWGDEELQDPPRLVEYAPGKFYEVQFDPVDGFPIKVYS